MNISSMAVPLQNIPLAPLRASGAVPYPPQSGGSMKMKKGLNNMEFAKRSRLICGGTGCTSSGK